MTLGRRPIEGYPFLFDSLIHARWTNFKTTTQTGRCFVYFFADILQREKKKPKPDFQMKLPTHQSCISGSTALQFE